MAELYFNTGKVFFNISTWFNAKGAVWNHRYVTAHPPQELTAYLKLRSDEQPSEGDMMRAEAVLRCAHEKGYPDAPLPEDAPKATVGTRQGPLDDIAKVATTNKSFSVTV